MTLKFKVLTIALFVFYSCSEKLSDQKNSKQIDAIHSVMQAQAQAWNNGDLDGYMQGYWKSDSLVFTGGKNRTKGWHQSLDRYKKSYPTKISMGMLTFSELETNLISDISAFTTGVWVLDKDSNSVNGRFTLVWKRIHNQWLIIADHTS